MSKIALADLMVNPLGEVISNGDLVVGSINIADLERRLKRKHKDADIQAEFNRILKRSVTGEAYKRVQETWRLQKHNTGKYRVWMKHGGVVVVSIEFQQFVSNTGYWSLVQEAARSLDVEPHLLDQSRCVDRKSPDGGKTWLTGPGHGKMQRQVGFDFPLIERRSKELLTVMKLVSKATEIIWNEGGVNVF